MTQTNRCWTFMVYMSGDNSKILQEQQLMAPMEQEGYQSIAEMEAVGSTDSVAVLVQFNTSSDPENAYRLHVRSARTRQIQKIPKQNVGDSRSLRDFIIWGMENYPAKHYAVILWNHGGGWQEDDVYTFAQRHSTQLKIAPEQIHSVSRATETSSAFFLSSVLTVMSMEDRKSPGIADRDSSCNFLDSVKLQQAFWEAEAQTQQKVNLIGMDACLTNALEVAYQLRNHADYLVGSQELEPLVGWYYTPILQALTANPGMAPEALAKLIVRKYGQSLEEYTRGVTFPIALSAINLTAIERLAAALGRLASVLRQLLRRGNLDAQAALSLSLVRYDVVRFEDEDFVDLYDFLSLLRAEYAGEDTQLKNVLDELLSLMGPNAEPTLVLANVTAGRISRARGLSIYLPNAGYSYCYDWLDADFGWGELIRVLNKLDRD